MPTFGIFEASVSIDNVNLTEYNVVVDAKKKIITCWIPSEAGKVSSVFLIFEARSQNNVSPFSASR